MSTIKYLISSTNISKLKQKAKSLKKDSNLTHTQALEVVAKQVGLDNWHQVTEANKPYQDVEKAKENGFIIIYDTKDAEDFYDEQNRFTRVSEDIGLTVCRPELYNGLVNEVDDNDIAFKDKMDNAELEQFYQETYGFYDFKLYTESSIPHDINAAVELLSACCFFQPEVIFLKGRMYNWDEIIKAAGGVTL
jgi:hypothetical protein